jgi:hypothetical protein
MRSDAPMFRAAVLCLFAGAAIGPAGAEPLIALDANGTVLRHFDSAVPGSITATVAVTGLQPGETLVGIDERARSGALFALGRIAGASDTLRLYRLDPYTGATVLVGVAPVLATPGADYGVDFNPAVDRVRVVNSGDENLRVNPNNGARSDAPTNDSDLSPAAQQLVAAAYDRNVDGTSLSTLFAVARATSRLVRIGGVDGAPSPNLGQVTSVGSGLGFALDAGRDAGLDIAPSGVAYLGATSSNITRLFTVDLATGAALSLGTIGDGSTAIRSLAALTPPMTLFALDPSVRQLLRFTSITPERIDEATAITGLQGGAGEVLLGIDFAPVTSQLYLLSRTQSGAIDSLRLYRLDPASGVAVAVGAPIGGIATAAGYGFDYNPSVDRIRVVNTAEANLRINPFTGARTDVAPNDSALTPTPVDIDASAYALLPGDVSSTLFGLDRVAQSLVRIGGVAGVPSANAGAVTVVSGLGVAISGVGGVGYDIPTEGAGFAVLTDAATGATGLFRINEAVTPGGAAATRIGTVGTGALSAAGLAILPPPPTIFTDGFE